MYLRDCKNTQDFKENFIDPFVNMEISKYRNSLIQDFVDKYGYDNEYYKFLSKRDLDFYEEDKKSLAIGK